jgi:hypothetical protein
MLMELTLAVTNCCAVQSKCHGKTDTTSRARGCAATCRLYLRGSIALHGESLAGQDMTSQPFVLVYVLLWRWTDYSGSLYAGDSQTAPWDIPK